MTQANHWLLPEGVDDILPPQASQLEALRRDILDLHAAWGYELVITSLIEFLETLLCYPSEKLQLQTFKVVDQLSGRMMGLRADITSQVARIDAHVLNRDVPTRLCYANDILLTRPEHQLASRSPYMIGAELYGHAGVESDLEVITLMLETLAVAGVEGVQLSLGHVNIYHSLIKDARLPAELERKLVTALQRKAGDEIARLLHEAQEDKGAAKAIQVDEALIENLQKLSALEGDASILDAAERELAHASEEIGESLGQLRTIAAAVEKRFPRQTLYFDLGELRGYEYHTGMVFAAYVPGHGEAVAKGGRYDDLGEVFDRPRAATGFDADLKTLLSLSARELSTGQRIFAPAAEDPDLADCVKALRAAGRQVVMGLPGDAASARDLDCDHQLVKVAGTWQVQALSAAT